MAVIYEDALKKNITSKNALPVYVLFGDDGYLKKVYTDKISHLAADSDDVFNYAKFTSECDLQDVYDAVMQMPMMNDKKCVILSDYDFEKCDKISFEKLVSLIEQTPDTTIFILVFESVEFDSKKSERFKRLIAAAEKVGGKAVSLNHRNTAQLSKMLCDAALKRGCNLDSSTARYLIEIASDDINLLKNELDKLCAFAGNRAITKTDIDLVSTKTVDASVYNLSKHILSCDISGALKVLDELYYMTIDPMIILYTVSGVYIDMYRVFLAKNEGLKLSDVDEIFSYKTKAFLIDRAAQNLRKLDYKKLKLSLEALLWADGTLKSFSADSRIILEQLVLKLIYIISKGEAVD